MPEAWRAKGEEGLGDLPDGPLCPPVPEPEPVPVVETHTRKMVLIKTIETRDGEVNAPPLPSAASTWDWAQPNIGWTWGQVQGGRRDTCVLSWPWQEPGLLGFTQAWGRMT